MTERRLLESFHQLLLQLKGTVLEIGAGRFPLVGYLSSCANGIALDSTSFTDARAVARVVGSATRLPFGSSSLDTVVTSFLLCSVGDASACLQEIRRVLKPNGVLLMLEHGPPRDRGWLLFARVRDAIMRRYGKCKTVHDPFSDIGEVFPDYQRLGSTDRPIPWNLVLARKEAASSAREAPADRLFQTS